MYVVSVHCFTVFSYKTANKTTLCCATKNWRISKKVEIIVGTLNRKCLEEYMGQWRKTHSGDSTIIAISIFYIRIWV
jgi:hypothetical protein